MYALPFALLEGLCIPYRSRCMRACAKRRYRAWSEMGISVRAWSALEAGTMVLALRTILRALIRNSERHRAKRSILNDARVDISSKRGRFRIIVALRSNAH